MKEDKASSRSWEAGGAIIATVFAVFLFLTANQTQAFTDVKGGSVTIQESADGGDGGANLNDLISWLDQMDLQYHYSNIAWRGEFQNRLLLKLLYAVGGVSEYPQLVAFLDDKIIRNDWAWYYGGENWWSLPSNSSLCPKKETSTTEDGYTVCKYGLLSALEEQSSATEVAKLRQWLSANEPILGQLFDSKWSPKDTYQIFNASCALTCSQQDKYAYTFQYSTDKTGAWTLFSDNVFDAGTKTYTADKCENLKTTFTPQGEWFSMLSGQCAEGKSYTFGFNSPPTPFTACADKTSCLAGATEYDMSDGSKAKGVQKVPADFVSSTERSLASSNNTYVPCADGVCTPNTSGDYALTATTPGSTYYGQCSGSGATIAPPEAAIPAISSNVNLHVVNRAPVPNVTVSKNPIATGEEITAVCDIVDPDSCADKIARVKWSCVDSKDVATNCAFLKTGTNQWTAGSITNDILISERSNPYRATARFRASLLESYAVTCEAWDDDAVNPLSGTAVTGVTVLGACKGGDDVCDPNCTPPDPDCCQDGDDRCDTGCSPCDLDCPDCCGADSRCNLKCPNDPDCCVDPYCQPYCPGYGFEKCVIPAGSCNVIRTKPSMDIDAVKPLDEVRYQASVIGGGNPVGYTWFCDKNTNVSVDHTSASRDDVQSCTYANEGKYEPKALYKYNDEKGTPRTAECYNAAEVGIEVSKGVKAASSCSVSTDKTEVKKGDSITAKMSAVPGDVRLGSLVVTWKANGKTAVQSGDKPFSTTLDTAGANRIEAVVKNPDGTTVTCSAATVDVSDKIQFGN